MIAVVIVSPIGITTLVSNHNYRNYKEGKEHNRSNMNVKNNDTRSNKNVSNTDN